MFLLAVRVRDEGLPELVVELGSLRKNLTKRGQRFIIEFLIYRGSYQGDLPITIR